MIATKKKLALTLLFAGITFLVLSLLYFSALPADFFPLDDKLLLDTPIMHAPLQWQSLKTFFTPGSNADFYPVRDLSYRVDISLFGFSPLALRWINIFYFSVASGALFFLFLEMNIALSISVGIASLWALHPFHAEMIVWVSSRKDILSILFMLLSLCCLVQSRKEKDESLLLGGSVFFFLLCCLSKASFSLIPVLLLLAMFLGKLENSRKMRFYAFGMCLIGAGFSLLSMWYYSAVNNMHSDLSFLERTPAVITALGKAMAGWIYPGANQTDLDEWGEWSSLNRPYLLLGILCVGAYVYSTRKAILRKDKNLLLGLCAVLFCYLAVPSVISAHRYTYAVRYFEPLSLVLFLLLANSVQQPMRHKYYLFLVVAICALSTAYLAQFWKNSLGVSMRALSNEPRGIVERTAVLRDLANLGSSLSPVEAKLRMESARYLENRCSRIVPIQSAYDAELSCHTYFGLGFQMSLWKKDYAGAERFLELSHKIEYKNIHSPRQLDRMDMEFKLALGTAAVKEADHWLRWQEFNLDERNRLITLAALCLRGDIDSAKEKRKRWENELLLEPTSVDTFEEESVAPNLRPAIHSCLH